MVLLQKTPHPLSDVSVKDKTFSNVAGSSSLGGVVVVLAADGVDVIGLLLLQVRLLQIILAPKFYNLAQ